MKWIKPSELLPENGKTVITRGENNIIQELTYWVQQKRSWQKSIIEWLDESGSEPEGKGFKWNDDLVKRYAEVYRFSSSRTSIEQFKENPDWASQETVNENYKLAMQEVEPEGKEAVELKRENIVLAVVDVFNDWREKNGRETIPAKAIYEIANNITDKIWKAETK